jgi:hypothetical protein
MDAIARIHARAGSAPWWSDRWAWRGALAAAPLGALAAILHALVERPTDWVAALLAYLVGAMVAAGIGCLLGGPLGAAGVALRQRLAPPAELAPVDVEEAAYVEHEQRTWAAAAA